jgi:hypothetical protein
MVFLVDVFGGLIHQVIREKNKYKIIHVCLPVGRRFPLDQ